MRVVAVIPARYGSTRLPAKALANDTGKYLVQHVYERVAACQRIDRVLVATDHERIVSAVQSFGGDVIMTRADHVSGTDRVAEAALALGLSGDDVVVNVQGDEPEVTAEVLDQVVKFLLEAAARFSIATPASRFSDFGPVEGPGSPHDPSRVKVVMGSDSGALYFSRSVIPYPRATQGRVDRPSRWYLHLGVYAFRAMTLAKICGHDGLPPGDAEQTESLEQLRWLQAGYRIGVAVVEHSFTGIDTPGDYAAFVEREKAAASGKEFAS